ncbi:hypothetical protein V498_07205 [Pseudogymnoascus sp. VKM F-4517 (FW-2822)]|nr:hypothetical protein V498_07205 [Pseudogymnoascus sp. VKM F-4517 (FW-2822)]
MKVIQAILSAFWLLTHVNGVAGHGAGGGGGVGGETTIDVLGVVTITIPGPPQIISFLTHFGTDNIVKPTPHVASTSTDTAVTLVDTSANTEVTASTAAITGAIDTPTVIIDTIRTSAAVTVNTPIASESVDIWITTTVSAYVTICPSPTTFTQGVQTYTVVEATTLTITNCPCTISYPAPPNVATTPPSVPVSIETGLNTPSGGPIVVTNNTSIPQSFNSTRTTFIAVTAAPPHATQPTITLGGSKTNISTPVPNTPGVPVQPTPTAATGGADRIFIGLGAAFLSGIVAVFL